MVEITIKQISWYVPYFPHATQPIHLCDLQQLSIFFNSGLVAALHARQDQEIPGD
jgi:hypothetical protein